jgi:hypothetical protein
VLSGYLHADLVFEEQGSGNKWLVVGVDYPNPGVSKMILVRSVDHNHGLKEGGYLVSQT